MPSKKYFCARPTLASQLLADGHHGEPTTNPFHPERPAWSFDLTTSLAFQVAEFYRSIQKPIPNAIKEHLQAEAPRTAEEYLN